MKKIKKLEKLKFPYNNPIELEDDSEYKEVINQYGKARGRNPDDPKDPQEKELDPEEDNIEELEENNEEVDNEDDLDDNGEIDDEDQKITTEENKSIDTEKEEGGEQECLYRYAEEEDSEAENEEVFDDDNKEYADIIPPEERITKPFLFKYERVRLIGDRAKQLALGAKPLIKNIEHLPPKKIAELELENNIIPLIIERPLPNGKKERWLINELQH